MAGTSPDGGCCGGGGCDHQHQPKRSAAAAGVGKGKSCTGCLYYSSLSKLHGRNPRCIGVTRTIPQVPLHRVGEAEMDANEEGRSLSSGFKYSCVGYSVFLDNQDNPNDKGENRPELPSCVGIEILMAKPSTPHHVPAYAHNKEDGAAGQSQPRPQKPMGSAPSPGDEFFGRKARKFYFHTEWFFFPLNNSDTEIFVRCRFTRNAGLVASGVAKNLKKVGNYFKDTLDDMMYPYGRRPK